MPNKTGRAILIHLDDAELAALDREYRRAQAVIKASGIRGVRVTHTSTAKALLVGALKAVRP